MVETWRAGEIQDAHQDMMKLTLEIVCRALFDIEIGPDQDRIAVALSTLMQLSTGGRMLLPQLLRRFPTASNQRYERANLELDDVVFRLIRSRQGAQGTGGNGLLTALLQARYDDGSAMTEQQLRDEVMTLLLAGHETTAVTLSWIWLLVSQHPEVERQLLREIDCVLGTRSVAAQDISQLRVTESVVKEAMRLYPPAWALVRTAANKVEIGGYTVPAGSSVVMSQWVMHRDPRFYEEPERFRPERWLNESSTPLPRFAYFPFGGGPRICIGAAFAMTEAVLVLATVAQRWKLRLEPGWAPAPVPGITLRPRGGIKVRVEPRS